MSHGFILFDDGFVGLRVFVNDSGLATIVKEKLGLVEIFLITSHKVEFGKCHLCYLMSWDYTSLSWVRTNLAADTVGISDGNIEEFPTACSLIVGNSTLYHMTKVIEFMTQILFLTPTLVACPLMWLLGILGARGIEISVRLLC